MVNPVTLRTLLCSLLISFSSFSLAAEPVHFGLVAGANKATLKEIWTPLLDDLSAHIGRPVKPVFFDDYASGVWFYNSGKVDIGWAGNRMAIELVDNAQAEIFLQVLNTHGQPGYYSHLIVHKDSPYHSVDDIFANATNITFGFGDPKSTSGTMVPMYYLFSKSDISHFEFNRIKHSNHEQNFHAVAKGELEVATVASVMLERFRNRYQEEMDSLRIIWSSPLIPTDAILKRKGLPDDISATVQDFFLQYGKLNASKNEADVEQERAILSQIKWSGFKRSDNSQLKPIRQLELANRIKLVENDPNLSDEMKQARIKALQEKLRLIESE